MRVQLNARNRAYEFEADPGEKVLYAGLRSRIDLPYECGTGTCGTCKARLVAGRLEDGWPEASGRKYLKGQGEFLMCQCAPAADLTVEVASFVYAMDSGACPAVSVGGVVADTRALTHDVTGEDFDARGRVERRESEPRARRRGLLEAEAFDAPSEHFDGFE